MRYQDLIKVRKRMDEEPILIPSNDFEPMINGMDLDDESENMKLYSKLMKSSKSIKLHSYGGTFDIIVYCDKYVLLNHISKMVDYYVKVDEGNYKAIGKWSCQVEVWRRLMSPKTGIVSFMFDNYILPKHGTVISDSMQTKMGKSMWAKLAFHALENNQYVYGYDNNTGTLTKFNNASQFDSSVRQYYGTEKKFSQLRLVISNNKL